MKLYHGTNGAWVDNILKHGLEPRGSQRSRNNWKHVPHQSNPKCVYLTDSYAPYFAFNASRGRNPSCAVVEIDTDLIDGDDFFADEDFLEQALRSHSADTASPGLSMSQRTLWYRSEQFKIVSFGTQNGNVDAWRLSLKGLGTCAHRGTIPANAITRIAKWPHKPNIWVAFWWDPTISLVNQEICGDRYRALTAKLLGDQPEPLKPWDQKTLDHFDPAKIENLEIINRNLGA